MDSSARRTTQDGQATATDFMPGLLDIFEKETRTGVIIDYMANIESILALPGEERRRSRSRSANTNTALLERFTRTMTASSSNHPNQESILEQSANAVFIQVQRIRNNFNQLAENHGLEILSESDEEVILLADMVQLVLAMLENKKAATPKSLTETSKLLHGLIPMLPSKFKVANQISRVCETFWEEDRPECNMISTNACMFLLYQISGSSSQKSGGALYVKRLYTMKKSLIYTNLEDRACSALRAQLLLLPVSNSFILRSKEGIKFTAFLLASASIFGEALVLDLHRNLVRSLSACRKYIAQNIGEAYFRAWKTAFTAKDQVSLSLLEQQCIQGLMETAIYASKTTLASNITALLMAFHAQKRERGIDEMLYRLYSPIIFRALAVANAHVRRNAANIFVDAFPIHTPNLSKPDLEKAFNQQCEWVLKLLRDDAVEVRLVAVQGACRLLSMFWAIFPITLIRDVIHRLMRELAFDSTSTGIRVTVLEGLKYVLSNHESHAMMKIVLPSLYPLFHDVSERVRLAMVDLLHVVSHIHAIRFFDIVPLDDLLNRLPRESDIVKSHICRLLKNSYFPLEAEEDHDSSKQHVADANAAAANNSKSRPEKNAKVVRLQIIRCFHFLQNHADAARTFYAQLHLHAPLEPSTKFVRGLAKAMGHASFPHGLVSKVDAKGNKYSSQDVERVKEHAFDLLADMISGLSLSLGKDENKPLSDYLNQTFINDELLVRLLSTNAASIRIQAACWRIAAHLPEGCLPGMEAPGAWITEMNALRKANDVYGLLGVFEAAVAWGYSSEIFSLIKSWIEEGFLSVDRNVSENKISQEQSSSNADDAKVKGSKKRKDSQEEHEDSDTPKNEHELRTRVDWKQSMNLNSPIVAAMVGCNMLDHALSTSWIRDTWYTPRFWPDMSNLCQLLSSMTPKFYASLASSSPSILTFCQVVLCRCMSLALRVSMYGSLLEGKIQGAAGSDVQTRKHQTDASAPTSFESIAQKVIEWISQNTLNSGDDMVFHLAKAALSVLVESLSTGVWNYTDTLHLKSWLESLLAVMNHYSSKVDRDLVRILNKAVYLVCQLDPAAFAEDASHNVLQYIQRTLDSSLRLKIPWRSSYPMISVYCSSTLHDKTDCAEYIALVGYICTKLSEALKPWLQGDEGEDGDNGDDGEQQEHVVDTVNLECINSLLKCSASLKNDVVGSLSPEIQTQYAKLK